MGLAKMSEGADMKTIEEFNKELEGSEALKNELGKINGKEALEAFLQKNGCGFTAEEYKASAFSEGELDDDTAEEAAGGRGNAPGQWGKKRPETKFV